MSILSGDGLREILLNNGYIFERKKYGNNAYPTRMEFIGSPTGDFHIIQNIEINEFEQDIDYVMVFISNSFFCVGDMKWDSKIHLRIYFKYPIKISKSSIDEHIKYQIFDKYICTDFYSYMEFINELNRLNSIGLNIKG